MRTVSAEQARTDLSMLINQIADAHEAVLLAGKNKNAVLVSEEDRKSLLSKLGSFSRPPRVDTQSATSDK